MNRHFLFTIQFNSDKTTIERSIYGLFDYISDVGGFKDGFMGIILLILAVFGVSSLDIELVTRLFRLPREDENNRQKCGGQLNICNVFHKCSKKDKRDKKFEKAKEILAAEANIIDIVQQLRYV